MRIALVEPSRPVQRIVTGTIGPWSHEVCPFIEVAERMLQRAYTGQPFSVLICDLGKFKAINDTYGHAIDDIVLQKVGREAGSIDVAAGWLGGEEIAFLIEGRLDDAVKQAEC